MNLGFTQTGAGEDGATNWELDVGADWQPIVHHIAEENP